MDPQAVFKAYDVRGRVDTGEVTPELFRRIGAAMVEELDLIRVAVGRDCRPSSDSLFEGLVEGITFAGGTVIDLGRVPTDLIYYYSGARAVAGAVITASHNPPQYNGLKLCGPGAAPIGAETGLFRVRDRVLAATPHQPAPVPGAVTTEDAVDGYVDHLLAIVDPGSIAPMRVAVDGGNGMAGVTVSRVFHRLHAKLDGLYLEPDGTFPNHPADPLDPANLVDLIELVSAGGHHLGVAFDGDADRAFFIDDQGLPLSGSTVTALIARWMLATHRGAGIVHNLITSRAVPEVVEEAGGTPVRTRVGHSYIKQVMAETGAVFGGEHSGHYYFRDNYRADSGMLAMLILMRVISEYDRPLSLIRTDVERYHASGEVNFSVADPLDAIEKVGAHFAGERQDRLDGLTVDLGDVWFNLRPSNTEPLVRLNVESAGEERVGEVTRLITGLLEEEK